MARSHSHNVKIGPPRRRGKPHPVEVVPAWFVEWLGWRPATVYVERAA